VSVQLGTRCADMFVGWLMDLTFGGRMLDELASMSTDS